MNHIVTNPMCDAIDHTSKIKEMLRNVMEHAREDVEKVHDPKVQALYETTAEVLGGLIQAYDHAENKSEAAWR